VDVDGVGKTCFDFNSRLGRSDLNGQPRPKLKSINLILKDGANAMGQHSLVSCRAPFRLAAAAWGEQNSCLSFEQGR
jgi:hypothetical protein